MQKKHILLIETYEDKLEFFTDALAESKLDFFCSRARDIEQAKIILGNSLPDAIFIDIDYANTPGITFLKTLKNTERFKATPVIAYTTCIQQNEELLNDNTCDYMRLPGNVPAMALILNNCFYKTPEINFAEQILSSCFNKQL